jgi:hypothetical protein
LLRVRIYQIRLDKLSRCDLDKVGQAFFRHGLLTDVAGEQDGAFRPLAFIQPREGGSASREIKLDLKNISYWQPALQNFAVQEDSALQKDRRV